MCCELASAMKGFEKDELIEGVEMIQFLILNMNMIMF